MIKEKALLYASCYCQCWLLWFTDRGISHWEGHDLTCIMIMFLLNLTTLWVSFFKWGKQIFSQGLDWYYFPVALDVHFDKYAKSPALENKHLPFCKWLISLTCSCHVHVHTQQPLQWAEYVEQHSKKSNHDYKCLEPGLRHGLISSVHSPPPSHLCSTPSSASLPASSMPVLHPSFALHCPTLLISSGDGAGAMER